MSSLNIATFNLWKNESNLQGRLDGIKKDINQYSLDIICFQEDYHSTSISSSKVINKRLGLHSFTTPTRFKIRNNEYSSSNLTVLTKYKILAAKEIYFNQNKKEERACQFVEIEYNSKRILVINTHLCHINSHNRLEQIYAILETIKEYKVDITILCGDLNALPSFKEIDILKDKDFIDINRMNTHINKSILDYIFFKSELNFEIKAGIILEGYSDHHCLFNTMKIKETR